MKKIIFACGILFAAIACTNQTTENSFNSTDPQENIATTKALNAIPFIEAENYFFKNDQEIPSSPKITTQEEFEQLFGMAALMGDDGKPTDIDFEKQFVLAVVLPPTDIETDIDPESVELKGDSLVYTYEVEIGEKLSYTIQPMSIIILDKKYADYPVDLVRHMVTD